SCPVFTLIHGTSLRRLLLLRNVTCQKLVACARSVAVPRPPARVLTVPSSPKRSNFELGGPPIASLVVQRWLLSWLLAWTASVSLIVPTVLAGPTAETSTKPSPWSWITMLLSQTDAFWRSRRVCRSNLRLQVLKTVYGRKSTPRCSFTALRTSASPKTAKPCCPSVSLVAARA